VTTFLPPDADLDDLVRRQTRPGRAVAVIRGTADRAGTFDAFARALQFPGYFGRNLDALLDCLRELNDPMTLIWVCDPGLRTADPAGYRGILAVLGQFADEHPDARIFVIG
jgi:RNAse (barnase) inhibitor barstar